MWFYLYEHSNILSCVYSQLAIALSIHIYLLSRPTQNKWHSLFFGFYLCYSRLLGSSLGMLGMNGQHSSIAIKIGLQY